METVKTYELAKGGPSSMSWAEYDSWLRRAWSTLLNRDPPEPEVQKFLESHPCLVPGGEGGTESIGGHHGAFPDALISQAELPGLTKPVPDFLWVSKLSSVVKPVLIEIERPGKRYFRATGRPTERVKSAQLTEAEGQISHWKDWFENEAHRTLFYDRYGIDDFVRRYHRVDPVYCLIYGRRREFENDEELSTLREAMRPGWLIWRTFDSLRPLYDARHAICIKFQQGHFKVVAVPPTLELGPENVEGLLHWDGLDQAISGNPMIPTDRKRFLLSRLPYWRDWLAQEQRGAIEVGVYE
jgi:antiviral defense system Shedu protein SduA